MKTLVITLLLRRIFLGYRLISKRENLYLNANIQYLNINSHNIRYQRFSGFNFKSEKCRKLNKLNIFFLKKNIFVSKFANLCIPIYNNAKQLI